MTYFRKLWRAVLGADSEILAELHLIRQEQFDMSVQSDRLAASVENLNNTITNVVVPVLQAPAQSSVDSEAALSSAADAVDAANQRIIDAVPATTPAQPVAPVATVDAPAA